MVGLYHISCSPLLLSHSCAFFVACQNLFRGNRGSIDLAKIDIEGADSSASWPFIDLGKPSLAPTRYRLGASRGGFYPSVPISVIVRNTLRGARLILDPACTHVDFQQQLVEQESAALGTRSSAGMLPR